MKSDRDRSWEEVFSDMVYWKFDGIPSDLSIRSSVGFMERALQLSKGAKVLDLGCGLGGHSIELARRGYQVTALEWSKPFIEFAQRQAAAAGVPVRFIQGDMTRMTFDKEFDAVVLWGNTFGMFAHEDNVATLRGMARALKQAGLALIDTQNYTGLPAELSQGWSFHHEQKDLLFLTQGTKDVPRARFGFDVLAIDLATGKRHKMPFSWRLYLLPELEHLLAEAGFILLGVYGDDPRFVDWKNWQRGEPDPYTLEGFTERAAKRILLCQARLDVPKRARPSPASEKTAGFE